MNQVHHTLTKIQALLLEMGFAETTVTNPYRSEMNYVRGNLYCIPQYVERLGFLIEYAGSYEEAKNHLHEDGDSFPLEMGEEAVLTEIKKEVRYVVDKLES